MLKRGGKSKRKATQRAPRPRARRDIGPRSVVDAPSAQRAAQEQEDLRSLFEEAPVGYHEIDTAGIVRRVNRMECELLGLEPQEIVGRPVWELVAPEERAISREAVRKKLAGEQPLGILERKYVRRDGTILCVEIRENAIRNAKRAIVGIRSALLDVTVRRQAEVALRQSEARLRAILDHTGAIVYIKDLKGRYLLVNRRYEAVSRVAQGQILGKTDYELYPREVADVFRANDQRVLETKTNMQFEEIDVLEDGRHTYLSVKVPLLDANGEPYAVCGISTDITERKRVLESLRASEEQFRHLFEDANDIIYTLDLNGAFTSFNRAGEQITGYGRQEILGMNICQLAAPDYRALAAGMLDLQAKNAVPSPYELQILAKNGRRVAIEVGTRPIYKDGEPIGIQAIARDVTERKSLEEQLRQSQKMEAVGTLAGGVAHDFNNLLTVIQGHGQLILEQLPNSSPLRKSAEQIAKTSERAASLTQQLLAFGRQQVLQPRVLDLNQVVGDTGTMLRRLIGAHIETVTIQGTGLEHVKADPGQLQQVILNLAVNARDAMPQGGKMVIATSNVYLDAEYARQHLSLKPGPYVMLSVSDTGSGMDADTRERIFEPFFTTKELGKGTGLGLSTVYGIVKQSGGHIWVYSELGRGSTFKIYFPRVEETLSPPPAILPKVPSTGSETILIVEDEPDIRDLACGSLTSLGYTVLAARNGAEALRLSEERPAQIHLVVTDAVMPGMSGRELAQRVKAQRRGIRILYMSGYTEECVPHGILDADVPFLQKPFTLDGLATKVREVLDRPSEG